MIICICFAYFMSIYTIYRIKVPYFIFYRIKSVYNGHVTSISELSSPLQSTWSTIYNPRADDVGIFEAVL